MMPSKSPRATGCVSCSGYFFLRGDARDKLRAQKKTNEITDAQMHVPGVRPRIFSHFYRRREEQFCIRLIDSTKNGRRKRVECDIDHRYWTMLLARRQVTISENRYIYLIHSFNSLFSSARFFFSYACERLATLCTLKIIYRMQF